MEMIRVVVLFFLLLYLSVLLTGFVRPKNFTIVVLPDTQFYSKKYPELFYNQTEWIVENKENLNIKIVLHLGDIVDNCEETKEWEIADKAMGILEGEVPYTVLQGNHDFCDNYEKYFGYSRFKKNKWYKGNYPENSNRNSYALFNVEGMNFGFLNLGFDPNNSEIEWANKVIEENQNYRFMVLTHSAIINSTKVDGIGYRIIQKILKKRDNIFLLTSGHRYNPSESDQKIIINGRTIHGIHTDYQNLLRGGSGILRYYEFSPEEDKIYAYTYNVHTKTYLTHPTSQFSIDYDMEHKEENPAKNRRIGIIFMIIIIFSLIIFLLNRKQKENISQVPSQITGEL